MSESKLIICPYCGGIQAAGDRCRACGGFFDALSRLATHNEMGPWFIRNERHPFRPGCSYETLIKLIERGEVTRYTVIRGPTTKQYWTVARRVPGVAHLLGYCYHCDASVDPADHGCHACGVPFGAYLDRNYLGLPEIRPLAWDGGDADNPASIAPAGHRFGFRRRDERSGISSFATDEELRGEALAYAPVGAELACASARGSEHVERAGSVEAKASPAADRGAPAELRPPAMESSLTASAMSAMRRKLAAQQRTIRRLAALAAVLAVIAAAPMLWLAAAAGNASGRSNSAEKDYSSANSQQDSEANARTAPDSNNVLPEASSNQDESAPDYEAEYARALELIAQAEAPDRSPEDAIRDYTEALEQLERIAAEASADRIPAGLHEKIEHVKRELERLRLEAFFP